MERKHFESIPRREMNPKNFFETWKGKLAQKILSVRRAAGTKGNPTKKISKTSAILCELWDIRDVSGTRTMTTVERDDG